MLLAAQEHGRRAEGAAQISATIGEPEPLGSGPLGCPGVEREADRRAAAAASCLDEGVGSERRGDTQRVVSAPGPEGGLPERQPVRPRCQRKACSPGHTARVVEVEPAGARQGRDRITHRVKAQPCDLCQLLQLDRPAVPKQQREPGLAELASGVDG